MFVGKIVNQKMDRHVYDDVIDFLKIVDDFKQFYKSQEENVILYRAVRDDNITKYFPSFFKVGDIIPQYVPFSTAMQPEFPIYLWSHPTQYSSILKIIVKDGLNGLNGIPISRFSETEMKQALSHPNTYQSEITLAPGTFTVVKDENIVVPEKDSSKMMTKRLLTVEYTPYTIHEFENIYYTTLRLDEDEDDEEKEEEYNQEIDEEELPEWANDVYLRKE